MTSMIEKVAAAMKAKATERGYCIHETFLHHAAAAAIEALRDVDSLDTPRILVAGKSALFLCSEDPTIEAARNCWHAMIDAVLAEKVQ